MGSEDVTSQRLQGGYNMLQIYKGRNGEKRSSVIEVILKTAGFRISVLSNLQDSGKHHFHG